MGDVPKPRARLARPPLRSCNRAIVEIADRTENRPTRGHPFAPIILFIGMRRVRNMKTIHIAEMIAQGGREGKVESADGGFSVQLSSEQPDSVTPEHLFAGAYGACFLGALKNAAETAHLPTEGMTVVAKAHLEEDSRGSYQLMVELRAAMPGVEAADAQHVLNLAHQTCP